MTPRERILVAIKHQEPDMVPVSPKDHRSWTYILESAHELDYDPIIRLAVGTPNLLTQPLVYNSHGWMCPPWERSILGIWDIKDVSVEMKVERSSDCSIVTRRFETPEGVLTDKLKHLKRMSSPDPQRLENLVKGPEDRQSSNTFFRIFRIIKHLPYLW